MNFKEQTYISPEPLKLVFSWHCRRATKGIKGQHHISPNFFNKKNRVASKYSVSTLHFKLHSWMAINVLKMGT